MKKYLVVGNPIEHSLSPDIHNYWFSKNKINASYEKRLIQTENIPEIMSMLRDGNLNGINITVPYKKDFVQLVDSLSLEAKETNSVNTIYSVEGKLIGHNTDIAGFELSIRHCKYNANKKKVLIIGAGGVVPSIIVALKRMNVEKIFIKNRTKNNALDLKKNFSEINLIDWNDTIDVDMVINATSIGLKKGEKLDIDLKKLGKNKFFYDVIYNPKETNFLKTGRKLGNITLNGKFMFIYQAHSAFNIWHGLEPEINENVIKLLD